MSGGDSLKFYFGTVSCGKTARLLVELDQYNKELGEHTTTTTTEKRAILIQPGIDDRKGLGIVWSRTGMNCRADYVIYADDHIPIDDILKREGLKCVIVDEVQFFTPTQVRELGALSTQVQVHCYGLRTDFRGDLFPGAAALLAIADVLEEIPTICQFCKSRKAVYNAKLCNGAITRVGPSVQVGCEETYRPVCSKCFLDLCGKKDDVAESGISSKTQT